MADYRAPLRRSIDDRMVAGVIGGLARYFGIDASLARVVYVIASVLSAAFPGTIIYLILWVVIPEE